MKRISKRKYPLRTCKQCGVSFIPTDARTVYCCNQHRVDYNNDQRKTKTSELTNHNKTLLRNESILRNIYGLWKKPLPIIVPFNFLDFMGFDFEVNSISTRNIKSNNNILWYLSLGIEKADGDKNQFIIYKKPS